jgi:hypothetical protein
MIVYFSAGVRTIKEDIETYRKILRAVQEVGGIVGIDSLIKEFLIGRFGRS